jgi:hypothetical protein
MSVRSRRNPALGATLRPPLDLPARFVGLTVPTARPGLENPVGPEALQMVDLALPLGYHGRFRRLASVKLIGPQGPDEARLAVQQFTQRFWDLDDTPCGLAEPRRRF